MDDYEYGETVLEGLDLSGGFEAVAARTAADAARRAKPAAKEPGEAARDEQPAAEEGKGWEDLGPRVDLSGAAEGPRFGIAFATGDERTAAMEHYIDPWLPKGTVVGMYGRGESGKSSWVSTLCAQASEQVSTLWISSEEETNNIAVRFRESGGQHGTVAPMTHTPTIEGTNKITVFDAYEHLESAILEAQKKAATIRPLGIVVLDAIGALVTWKKGENANDDGAVKRLLAHLHSLATRYGLTIVIIGHLNKNTSKEHGADAVTGSAAWTNSLRRAFMFYKDIGSEGDYDFFIRTAKANTGSHFAARYHTMPVHTLHKRQQTERDEVLCKTELTSEIVWGEKAIGEMIYDSGEDDPRSTAKKNRQNKTNAKLDCIVVAIREQGCRSRKEIIDYAASVGLTLRPDEFSRTLDERLAKERGITIIPTEHNQYSYR